MVGGVLGVRSVVVDRVRRRGASMSEVRTFHEELTSLINRHSLEGKSGTPDFILAKFMHQALSAFEEAVCLRDAWYSDSRGVNMVSGVSDTDIRREHE